MADRIPAAQYLRMSTDHQQYSLENQADALARYAETHGFQIVRTFSDAARSGLSCKRRTGLQELLKETISGKPEFQVILVYDVSRWGRFQDPDEAAHYEYLCKEAGVPIRYCAERFPEGTEMAAAILKAVKRSMAGEYSRELSAKVRAGKLRLAEMGFQQGSHAPYGLRRLLISPLGGAKQILEYGDRKSLQSDRVVLVPGPREEVETVQRIFREFVLEHRKPIEIARGLNGEGIKYYRGAKWSNGRVIRTLRQAKYAGSQVWGKYCVYLRGPRSSRPTEHWAVSPIQPIITQSVFADAQAEFASFARRLSNEQLIEEFRDVVKASGKLSLDIIRKSPLCHPRVYRNRFVSLLSVYDQLMERGHCEFLSYRQRALMIRRNLIRKLTAAFPGQLAHVGKSNARSVLEYSKTHSSVSVCLAKCIPTRLDEMRWQLQSQRIDRDRVAILALANRKNNDVQTILLFPHLRDVPENTKFRPDCKWLRKGIPLPQASNFAAVIEQVNRIASYKER